jgi:hypothetical protein
MPLWSRSRRGYAIERGFQSRKRLLNRVGASKDFDAAGVVQSDEQILSVWFGAARASIAFAGNDETLFSLALCPQCAPAHFRLQKHERPQNASVRENKQSQRRKLELRWHVSIGWHVAVDFETDADFNQNGRRPGHSILPLDLRENNRAEEHGTSSIRSSGGSAATSAPYDEFLLLEYANRARFSCFAFHPNAW